MSAVKIKTQDLDRIALRILLALMAYAMGAAAAGAASQAVGGSAPEALRPRGGAPNALTQAATAHGVLSCAHRIEQITDFLGFGPRAGAVLMLPPTPPDQSLVPLAMELPLDKGSAYVSVSFAPNQANGCGATYDAVAYWGQACEAVASSRFAGMKRIGLLKQGITVLDGGTASKVFLMPAGKGCVSIKKEVVQ